MQAGAPDASRTPGKPPDGANGIPSRRLEVLYLALLGAGCVLPYAHAVPWLVGYGVDVNRFRDEVFATAISSFFGWDVIVAVVTLLVVAVVDAGLRPAERVLVVAGSLAGASVGLPLYLWLRQRRRRRTALALRADPAARIGG
ncbi:DUF2834 domain-containing protein [Polymorphospora rubra]|uniref:DUF2834 domain-containing protein n=1 Tax=Polymorphospora rubra TaxID=338584 RepID=UPI0033EBC05D